MSVDRSLKIKGALSRHRNVLTRAERVTQLELEERWSQGETVTGLPKVGHRKGHSGRKSSAKTEKTEAEEAATTEETSSSTES